MLPSTGDDADRLPGSPLVFPMRSIGMMSDLRHRYGGGTQRIQCPEPLAAIDNITRRQRVGVIDRNVEHLGTACRIDFNDPRGRTANRQVLTGHPVFLAQAAKGYQGVARWKAVGIAGKG